MFEPLGGNKQGESHESKNAVEYIKHDCGLMHVLEDPFAVFLGTINSPNIFEVPRFKCIYNVSRDDFRG
jgi:hypothetical protein